MGTRAVSLSFHPRGELRAGQAGTVPAGGTVLVADDDPSVRRLVTLAFELDGFTVVSASDGREALDYALSLRPAAAVLDAVMPHLGGMEVSRRMRQALGRGPAVLILTGRTDVADRIAAFEAGADDYVVKPVRVTELVDRVKSHLEREAGQYAGKLLGSPEVYSDLRRRMRAGEAVAAMCVEVVGLRPFSRHYSYARAERVLRRISDLLVGLAAQRPGTVAGRLGADQFLTLTPPRDVTDLADDLLAAFAAEIPTFYDPADAERGWIDVTDRAGRTRRHRPLTLGVGVAASALGARSQHHLELVERAAEMARYAGTGDGSRVVLDRRS
jgi:DNA-binding response OmpR family regulator